MNTILVLNIILAILCLTVIRSFETADVKRLIISGDRATIEEAPYYAGLSNCGAVIISRTWVLTAAHCLEKPKPKREKYVWVGGETFKNSLTVPYHLTIIHEDYSDKNPLGLLFNDIGLIHLEKPLEFTDKIQSIKLPDTPKQTRNLMVVGRGVDETGRLSRYLKKLDLIGLTSTECLSVIPAKYQTYIRENLKTLEMMNVCATREGYRPSICSGDSGGPLVGGDTLVGLVSYGPTVCQRARLGFYVNVTTYVPWIRRHTGL